MKFLIVLKDDCSLILKKNVSIDWFTLISTMIVFHPYKIIQVLKKIALFHNASKFTGVGSFAKWSNWIYQVWFMVYQCTKSSCLYSNLLNFLCFTSHYYVFMIFRKRQDSYWCLLKFSLTSI